MFEGPKMTAPRAATTTLLAAVLLLPGSSSGAFPLTDQVLRPDPVPTWDEHEQGSQPLVDASGSEPCLELNPEEPGITFNPHSCLSNPPGGPP